MFKNLLFNFFFLIKDGKIPWAQAAEMMEGRSDNMILCRHRKLTEWKEKCEWLEKQDVSKILLVIQK